MDQKNILFVSTVVFVALMHPAHSVELITSDGAWTGGVLVGGVETGGGVVADPNNWQVNTYTVGGFTNWGGSAFTSNAPNQYLQMVADVNNVHKVYTAGYTYSYQSTASAVEFEHQAVQYVSLIGNGTNVIVTKSGENHARDANGGAFYGSDSRNTVSGSYVVSTDDAVIGETVGMRISSEGVQSRFLAEAVTPTTGSGVSALLTDHAGFNSGSIYSTSFNADGITDHNDHVLDMALSGNYIAGDGKVSLNTTPSARNTLLIGSADDTFRAGTIYRITFNANKAINNDLAQNDLTFSLGTYTTDITIGSTTDTYTFDVDADAEEIDGLALGVGIKAAAMTTGATNQYVIYDLHLVAIPEPGCYALVASLLGLGFVVARRRLQV
jgi:hypothetical protein